MIWSDNFQNEKIKKLLKEGGVGVIPTDTLYGVVASVFSKDAVERVYQLKKRDPKKPLIVLISDFENLKKFGINLDSETEAILQKVWPGPVSVILPVPQSEFEYLHRGENSIAFRLPNRPELRELIREVGPIVAPSANPEGFPPARDPEEVKNYFGESLDFIIAKGELKGEPSTLIEIDNGEIKVIRGKLK